LSAASPSFFDRRSSFDVRSRWSQKRPASGHRARHRASVAAASSNAFVRSSAAT
jgi:hypothetical protein